MNYIIAPLACQEDKRQYLRAALLYPVRGLPWLAMRCIEQCVLGTAQVSRDISQCHISYRRMAAQSTFKVAGHHSDSLISPAVSMQYHFSLYTFNVFLPKNLLRALNWSGSGTELQFNIWVFSFLVFFLSLVLFHCLLLWSIYQCPDYSSHFALSYDFYKCSSFLLPQEKAAG